MLGVWSGYGISAGAGFASGFLFSAILARFAPPALHRDFWVRLLAIARDIAVAETGRDFIAAYRRLGVTFGIYLARNLGGLLAGFLPLAIAGYMLNALLFVPWDGRSSSLATWPAALTVKQIASGYVVSAPHLAGPIRLGPAPVKAALCDGTLTCILVTVLNFERIVPEADGAISGTILVRSGGPVWNPLFPWLNDLEFVFLIASIGGAAAGFRGRPRE